MNLLLLEASEIDGRGVAVLRDRRARHTREVLGARRGQSLRAGVIDGALGQAVVEEVTPEAVTLRVVLDREPPPCPDTLLLAVPRPKVLLRMLAHAAALRFGRILLLRTWRVDRSHLQSRAMRPEIQRQCLLEGLEQAGRTRLPEIAFHPLFKPFVEDDLDALDLPTTRLVAHPTADRGTADLALGGAGGLALAIGPDGGFLPYEVERLAEHRFLPVHCGRHPLRTETALAVLSGQLQLLRKRPAEGR